MFSVKEQQQKKTIDRYFIHLLFKYKYKKCRTTNMRPFLAFDSHLKVRFLTNS
jgi:hypothetical protein